MNWSRKRTPPRTPSVIEPTEPLSRHTTFSEASQQAKRAANFLRESTMVKGEGEIWLVLVPEGTSYLVKSSFDESNRQEFFDRSDDPSTRDLLDDQDDWSRSQEDGWFYPD